LGQPTVLSLDAFTKRHLDEYLVYRADSGLSPTSLRHGAPAATVFFEWCKKNKLIDRDPLAEYKIRSAPKPYRYMPKEEDMQRLLAAIP
jgi:site-specific recombinase XerD